MISANDIQVTKNNVALFSTLLIVSNVVGNQLMETPLLDESWKNFAIATLIGVVGHSLLTNKFGVALTDFVNSSDAGINQSLYDLVMFGTIFTSQKVVVSQLQGVPIEFDNKWIMSSSLTIAGYAAFNMFIKNMVPQVEGKFQPLANDLVKFSMSALLAKYFVDGTINSSHLMEVAGLMSGFIAFHLVVKDYVVPK